VGIQQLLPPLFIAISRMEGLISFSEVQMRAFSRYFLFQVVNVFLVTTIAGSIFDTIAIIIDNPETMFELLGNSLPRMSSFFITFVTMKTFLGLGVELVRTMSLVQSLLRVILFPNATLRMKRSPVLALRSIDDPGWFPFHKILAQDMLVVVISVVFAVVAPLVLLPCAMFCLFSRIMWTHHHLYVYESVFETGGQFWPKIFRRFVFGLIIAQMTITGQFFLKEARHEAYATIALIFITYFFLRSTRARYDPSSSTLPLEVATVMDLSLAQEEAVRRQWLLQQLDQKRQETHGGKDVTRNENMEAQPPQAAAVVGTSNPVSDYDVEGMMGPHNPFQHAYLQPALRANPRARPEQPFPPNQLGREEVLLRPPSNSSSNASTLGGVTEDECCNSSGATVRLKSMNQQDRRLVNRWWNDQLQRCGNQPILPILIGEECGNLTIGKRSINILELSRMERV
jgi:Calcium-dependent channel, 7TM region, putative phosphate